jgi:hypothetical protein
VGRLDIKERADLWRKTMVMLKTISVDRGKLAEVEELVSGLTKEVTDSIKLGSSDPASSYEQQYLLARLQSTLEDFRKNSEELEQLVKNLQMTYQKIERDVRVREQIMDQLKRKLLFP